MPRISAIVTAYNEEQFIGRCIESLLSQDYADYEIIVVDDGSRDSSAQIIDELAADHPIIKVIHKENGGVTAARRTGVENATGEYVCFIDGDDYVLPTYLSELVAGIVDEETIVITKQGEAVTSIDDYINGLLANKIGWGLWKKLYPYKLLKDSFLLPREINLGEDLITNLNIASKAKSVISVESLGYILSDNGNSVTRSRKWSVEYEKLFISVVESTLGDKLPIYAKSLRQLALSSWKNLELNGVKVSRNDSIVQRVLTYKREGRLSVSEIIMRFVPSFVVRRLLLQSLNKLHK